jgi:NAD(P)-dependent dehydrogenase (short-subunit alcohol dehydrogenase family)
MSTISDLSGRTAIVVGAIRGLGRGIATALVDVGAPVIAVARTPAACLTAMTRTPWFWSPGPRR